MYKNLPKIQYTFCCYYLISDTTFWSRKPYTDQRMSWCTKCTTVQHSLVCNSQ